MVSDIGGSGVGIGLVGIQQFRGIYLEAGGEEGVHHDVALCCDKVLLDVAHLVAKAVGSRDTLPQRKGVC